MENVVDRGCPFGSNQDHLTFCSTAYNFFHRQMICAACQRSEETLIKIYVSSFNHQSEHVGLVTCLELCRPCLIGKTVPVHRPDTNGWQIGEVTGFDQESEKHRMLFLDETEHWVVVEQSPFDAYLSYHQTRCRRSLSIELSTSAIEPWPLDASEVQGGSENLQAEDRTENARLMQKVLRRIMTNGSQDLDDDFEDWSLRRVELTCEGKSPLRHAVCDVQQSEIPWPRYETLEVPSDGSTDESRVDDDAAAELTLSISTPSKLEGCRRPGPRMWTDEEDKELLKCVESATTEPIKWTLIAESIPGRSGKQCRERYLNHLKPKIKVEDWSPTEDALLFHIYASVGSKWSMMTKLLRGRTENGIKNRFHFLRRRLDKDVAKFLHKSTSYMDSSEATERDDILLKIREMLPFLAVETATQTDSHYAFGPFRRASGDWCKRCSLLAPSLQTGGTVCGKTGWCEACTRLPPYVSGDQIRVCLSLRRVATPKTRDGSISL